MRRVKITGDSHQVSKKPKRRLGKPATGEDEALHISKPGLETSFPHIAQMWVNRDNDLARELTHRLRPHCAKRLGIRRLRQD